MQQPKQQKTARLPAASSGAAPSLTQLRALRLAQKESNQRIDELKMRLFRITEQHMDQAVRLVRRWMTDKE